MSISVSKRIIDSDEMIVVISIFVLFRQNQYVAPQVGILAPVVGGLNSTNMALNLRGRMGHPSLGIRSESNYQMNPSVNRRLLLSPGHGQEEAAM